MTNPGLTQPSIFAAKLKIAAKVILPAPTRRVLRHIAYCVKRFGVMQAALGSSGSWRFLWVPIWNEMRRLISGNDPVGYFLLNARDAAHPMRCRYGTSDLDVFRQIFVEREYRCVSDLDNPLTMIDCGANVGFASAWFLSRYPRLQVVAVEPDPANVAAALENLAPFGSRVTILESGVWSRSAPLKVVRGAFGDGREWATQVREANPNETADLTAVDIPTLIKSTGRTRIDILKIDIEGSEGQVFSEAPTDWLDCVENMVIEIHGPELEILVDKAIPPEEFIKSRSDELTCYRRV